MGNVLSRILIRVTVQKKAWQDINCATVRVKVKINLRVWIFLFEVVHKRILRTSRRETFRPESGSPQPATRRLELLGTVGALFSLLRHRGGVQDEKMR